jgi:hypothetical protein
VQVLHVGQVDHVGWDVGVGDGDPLQQHLAGRVPLDIQQVAGAVAARQGGEVGLDSGGVDCALAGPTGPQLLPARG